MQKEPLSPELLGFTKDHREYHYTLTKGDHQVVLFNMDNSVSIDLVDTVRDFELVVLARCIIYNDAELKSILSRLTRVNWIIGLELQPLA